MHSYWDKVLNRRMSRRRTLVGSSALAASAAFLAACGGDDDDGSSDGTGSSGGATGGSGSSSLVHMPVNETAQAKHGGTYITTQNNAFAIAPDPHQIGAHGSVGYRVYSQLLKVKAGVLQNTEGEIMGDLAQSWELSPDFLTLTIKLEPEAGFSPVEPVNGRIIDSEDITFSWRRMIDVGARLRGDLANEISPDAPIISVEAPDKNTVVLNLAEPNSTIYTLIGHQGLGSFYILPKEAADENVLDIGQTPVGTGPYYVTELRPEANINFSKNPNFKRSTLTNNEPYIENIEMPIILEAATRSAQFRAGAVHETAFPRLEIVGAKKDQPELLMYTSEPPGTERVYFGHNPDSPFIDERMRKAYYKCIDRDAYIRAAYDVDFFEKDGLEVDQFWEGSFERTSWSGWLLDPKSKEDYGDAQQNFEFDLAEAKALVEAAGHETPFNFTQVRATPGPTSFSQPIYDRMQIIEGMHRESGVFTFEFNDLEWATEWLPQVRASGGAFSGASWGPDTSSADPSAASFFVFHPSGGYFEGGDDMLKVLAQKIRGEFDVPARKELVKELQRYDAEHMFNQKLGVASGFELAWPVIRNVGVFRGGTNWMDISTPAGAGGTDLQAWLDTTQPPLNESRRFWSTSSRHA